MRPPWPRPIVEEIEHRIGLVTPDPQKQNFPLAKSKNGRKHAAMSDYLRTDPLSDLNDLNYLPVRLIFASWLRPVRNSPLWKGKRLKIALSKGSWKENHRGTGKFFKQFKFPLSNLSPLRSSTLAHPSRTPSGTWTNRPCRDPQHLKLAKSALKSDPIITINLTNHWV